MHSQSTDPLSSIQECPVFEPTKEEFSDPIFYITKIRPIGEKTGIVKIRPPPDWNPPFCRDPEQFLFSPRIQCLRELEGINRVKLNFTDNFIHFWDLHGQNIIKPVVGGQPLDLYKFFDLANKEGGFHQVCTRKLWSGIGRQLGLTSDVQWSSVLKDKYRKLLYPFEYFLKIRCLLLKGEKLDEVMYSSPRGLLRPLFSLVIDYKEVMCCAVETQSNKLAPTFDPAHCPPPGPATGAKSKVSTQGKDITCQACHSGDEEQVLLICEACEVGFHTFCLYPALEAVPPGDWRCPGCIHRLYKPACTFGFEHTKRPLSLNSFSHAANIFKRTYFENRSHNMSCREIEREFWSLLASPDSTIEVHYGSDLHSSQHGSGFPCEVTDCDPSDQHYIDSGWNLNNIAYLEGCVLKHVPGDISGLKKPWLYIGMCFSTFCWHVEDHWNHSINYLHYGDPKTWYGVPSYAAKQFENCVREYVPGLIANDPHLLHHLITMIPPRVLLEYGVPIFRADQCKGEFMITFPRAYHAGFNQGLNFAEAVNFATKEWFITGRECVEVYKKLRKPPIFSHNELVCRCFASPLTPGSFGPALFEDINTMVTTELDARKRVFQTPMHHVQLNFELLPETHRSCHSCRTLLFLSSIMCDGCNSTRFCLEDLDSPCPCGSPSRVFQYRYSGQELFSILDGARRQAEAYTEWMRGVEAVISAEQHDKPSLDEVEGLFERGTSLNYDGDSLTELCLIINKSKLVAKQTQQLLSKRNGNRHSFWLYELSELEGLAIELQSLPCSVPQTHLLQEKILETRVLFERAQHVVETNSLDFELIGDILFQIQQLQVHSPLCDTLSDRHKVASWLRDYNIIYERCTQDTSFKPTLLEAQQILSVAKDLPITCQDVQTSVMWLDESISQANIWLKLSKTALKGKCKRSLEILQGIYNEKEKLMISVSIPSELTNTIRDAQAWKQSYSSLPPTPTLSQVEELVENAAELPVLLPGLDSLKNIKSEADSWKQFLTELFLIENSEIEILFGLLPAAPVPQDTSTKLHTLKCTMDILASCSRHSQQQESQLMASLLKQELCSIREIRKYNMEILYTASSPSPPLDKILCVTCGKRASEQMIFCNRCLSLQHGPCAGLSLANIEITQNTFVCTRCVRTNRPTLSQAKSLVSLWSLHISSPYTRALQLLVERADKWEAKSSNLLDSFQPVAMETDSSVSASVSASGPAFNSLNLSQQYKEIEDHLIEGLSIEIVLENTSACVELWREAFRQKRKNRVRGRKAGCPTTKPDSCQPRKPRLLKQKKLNVSHSDPLLETKTETGSDDTCAAMECICLQVEKVDWIQCDTCEAWFHFICVGLTQSEVSSMGDYNCPACNTCKIK